MAVIFKYDNLNCSGNLVKRPSKHVKSPYIADIIINKEEQLAHCPALGVSGLLNTSTKFLCSFNDSKARKSKYTIELCYLPSSKNDCVLTSTNPNMGNKLFQSIINNNLIEEYENNKFFKAEKTYKDCRFDFYIKKENNREEYIEIKSVLLCNFNRNDYPDYIKNPEIHRNDSYKKGAIFPDGFRKSKNVPISERAIKHLKTLRDCKKNNIDASLYFMIQRSDCDYFKPSDVDQFYQKELKEAIEDGVNVKAISVNWNDDGSCVFNGFIPVIIH
jgi:DNA-binding sugar fermentation-stimulating protein